MGNDGKERSKEHLIKLNKARSIPVSQIYERAIEILTGDKHTVLFIDHLATLIPIDRSTFYRKFPVGSSKYNKIKALIEDNRIDMKSKMYQKWFDSENASLQIGLMKLIGSDKEVERLNGTRQHVEMDMKAEVKSDVNANLNVGSVKNIREAFGLNGNSDDEAE